jgi:hypothetical protein
MTLAEFNASVQAALKACLAMQAAKPKQAQPATGRIG